jgi:ubiquinone/menaquinone biosynthesis C-methylase UbiE
MKGTSTQPDLGIVRRSFEGYRVHLYDLFGDRPTLSLRLRAIKRLGDIQGATVVDVGCGTGLSLPYLVNAVGPQGRVIGIDASPDMLDRSRRRIESAGWDNVELVEAFAHEWQPDTPVDAVLMCNVNQLLSSIEVVSNVVTWLKPGGRIACAGGQKGRGLGGMVRSAFAWLMVMVVQRERTAVRWILRERPWQELESLLPGLETKEILGGNAFVAWGAKP